MSTSSTWITPKEGARRFRTLAQQIELQPVNALRRATNYWRNLAFSIFARRGLGRVFGNGSAVLGKKIAAGGATKQARVIIKREPPKKTGEGRYTSGLRLRGFAALVEGGGKTKPHEIKTRSRILAYTGRAGDKRFARSVKHPGSVIPRNPFVEEAAREAEPRFVQEMTVARDRAIELAKLAD